MISSYLGIDSWAPYLVTLIAEPIIANLIDFAGVNVITFNRVNIRVLKFSTHVNEFL